MNVGTQVRSLDTKFVINGQNKVGIVEGIVTILTTRKVVIQDDKEQLFQITPANFAKNFSEVQDVDQDLEQLNKEVLEEIEQQQADQSLIEQLDVKTQEIAKPLITRKMEVAQQMDLGIIGATAIAKAIGMNASYAQRLVSQIRKERE